MVTQSALIFLFAGYEYLTLMHFPSLPPKTVQRQPLPTVSIILPVRNQATTARECLNSLAELNYDNKEIIVVDGQSSDGTTEIIDEYRDRVTMVEEGPLPVGWVGKNWACQQGYEKSRGELLLFTDGDSIHSRDSLRRTVAYLQSTKADILTLAPSTILKSFWEKTLQPPIFLLIMLLVGGKQVNDDKRPNAIGNGQYMLFRRHVYEKIGGHARVRERIVEDYALARLAKKAGFRLRFVTGKDALGVRMYDSLSGIWRGWRKNFYTVSEKWMFWRAVLRNVLMFLFFVMPFITLAYGISLIPVNPVNVPLLTGAFMVFWLWLGTIILYRSINVNPLYALLFPLATLIYIGIGIDSTIRGSLGLGFSWKGRIYGRQIQRESESAIR
ncbi:MAG TPA: glycosyltransferase family 2 protein [Candidatus Bathyarchaeia archaeon]|nr:glycosyltransferase family 2 protein [Candidatus Bathyarchaeia archaeon]